MADATTGEIPTSSEPTNSEPKVEVQSEIKKAKTAPVSLNVGPAITKSLALASRGVQVANEQLQKHDVAKKVSSFKEHPHAEKAQGLFAKASTYSELLWTLLGLILIFHGAQFKRLFLCTQFIATFCYERVKNSGSSAYNDSKAAWQKLSGDDSTDDSKDDDDSKADAKAAPKNDNKHAQKRAAKKDSDKPKSQSPEEAAAATKKVLKVLDSGKIKNFFVELCISAVACHMAMEGAFFTKIIIVHALVLATKSIITSLLDFSEHEDVLAWTDLILNFVLYSFFGLMAKVSTNMALALNVALCGAQLVTAHGLRFAEAKKMVKSADAAASSIKGFALLGALAAFGTFWQFWALVANSGVSTVFIALYLPAHIAEYFVGIL